MVKLKRLESKTIQGIDPSLYSYEDVISIIKDYIMDIIEQEGLDIEIEDIQLHGSRLRSQAKDNSDLDAVVQYTGSIREDDLFNLLNESPCVIDDITVDINPIKEDMKQYMKRSDDYDKKKLGL